MLICLINHPQFRLMTVASIVYMKTHALTQLVFASLELVD